MSFERFPLKSHSAEPCPALPAAARPRERLTKRKKTGQYYDPAQVAITSNAAERVTTVTSRKHGDILGRADRWLTHATGRNTYMPGMLSI
jgi:hypothetical protein